MRRAADAVAWVTGLCALAALGGCAPERTEGPHAPALRERAPLATGDAQRARLCGRQGSDPVLDVFCGDARPTISGFRDLRSELSLNLDGPPSATEGFAMTGHSSSLVSRFVSSINPRVIFVRAESANSELL